MAPSPFLALFEELALDCVVPGREGLREAGADTRDMDPRLWSSQPGCGMFTS